MKRKSIFIALMVAIYFTGVLSGMFAGRYFSMKRLFFGPSHIGRGGTPEQHFLDMFAKRLNMTDIQRKQVVKILTDNKSTLDKSRDDFMAKMEKTMDAVNARIREILTDEQKKIFDQILKERPKRPEFGRRGPGGEFGPGSGHMPPDMPPR